ncbi:VOC family protein [Nonlabens xiamenensis]|uniref:hypothetical protein n=1 Tax=Nonlabens xiamenensis TaxID=2341043 RepID=UPI000F60572E|nr:hypothetical protein [Nonlabens xiamenensis]
MIIDHIFIFSNQHGKEADQLIDFGWSEGSSRRHPGQGTINRKFYFENFFLEILWIVDESEILDPKTAFTQLGHCSNFPNNECSRFGLGLVNTAGSDDLFRNSEIYQPDYFPSGMTIDIITNKEHPSLPWTFRLPFRDKQSELEPYIHENQMKQLTKVRFNVNRPEGLGEFSAFFADTDTLNFQLAQSNHLVLEFDHRVQNKMQKFDDLGLTIHY